MFLLSTMCFLCFLQSTMFVFLPGCLNSGAKLLAQVRAWQIIILLLLNIDKGTIVLCSPPWNLRWHRRQHSLPVQPSLALLQSWVSLGHKISFLRTINIIQICRHMKANIFSCYISLLSSYDLGVNLGAMYEIPIIFYQDGNVKIENSKFKVFCQSCQNTVDVQM